MPKANCRRVGQAIAAGCIALAAAGWWWQGQGIPSATTPVAAQVPPGEAVGIAASFAQQPLAFEPNQGQSDGRVLFLSRNDGYTLFLTAEEAVVSVRGAAQPLRLAWQGANPHPQAAGLDILPVKRHYIKGNDPAQWRRDIPSYGKVRYGDLYPGIDLVYYGRERQLEYDLVVAPGADPGQIRLRLAGMDALHLADDGSVQLQLAQQRINLSKPLVYQETAGMKKPVEGKYVLLADNQLGFKVADYDTSQPLIIDPVLTYSSYLGGSGAEQGKGVAVDGAGNIYVVGQTASADFPAFPGSFNNGSTASCTDPLQPTLSVTCSDVFVAKFNSAGTLLVTTYLGGSGTDRGYAIAADNSAVYITGDTDSGDFPVPSAAQAVYGGLIDAFVAKLNSMDLSPVYSTFLGGSDSEEALGIAVDGSGNAYVAGATLSDDFPTTGAFQAARNTSGLCKDPTNPLQVIPCSDAFVTKYASNGMKQYGTYFGGVLEDVATAIAVNSAGEAYVTGVTYSNQLSFPGITAASLQSIYGSFGDAFVLKFNGAGNRVLYSTYLGGGVWDQGQTIALDAAENIYVAGVTNSPSMSAAYSPPRRGYSGENDAFVASIDPVFGAVRYFTYLGGSKKDFAFGIAVNKTTGVAVVVGETMSADFPVDKPLQTDWFGGGQNKWGDMFVTAVETSGFSAWSTYLGGTDDDWANAVALDGGNGIYVAGSSFSGNFPLVNPYQATMAGGSDAVLFKLVESSASADLALTATAAPALVGSGETLTYTVVVTNNGPNDAGGVVIAATLPGGVSFSASTPAGICTASGTQVTCSAGTITAGNTATISLATLANTAGDITFTARVVRANQPDTSTANNSASVTTKAAVGSSGGGAGSPLDWLLGLVAYALTRRRAAVIR